MTRRKTQEEFEAQVKEVHGGNVVVLGEYVNNNTPVLIKYVDCGHEEMKLPVKLINKKHGCVQCRYKRLSKGMTKSTDDYIADLKKNGIDYIVPQSEYTGVGEKILVLNTRCGHKYSAIAGNVLNSKSGCPICHGIKTDDGFRKTINEKYPGEYTIIGEYTNGLTPVLIRHNECGFEWECTPKDLLRDRRCPNCMKSKGELFVKAYLEDNGIAYEREFTFPDCKGANGGRLAFDFKIVVDGKVKLIEFDGIQHFQWSKGLYSKKAIFENDKIKNSFCENHSIPLLRIPYWWLRTKKIRIALDEFCK